MCEKKKKGKNIGTSKELFLQQTAIQDRMRESIGKAVHFG